MLKNLIKNPITTSVLVLFFVILGIVSMQSMVMQNKPDIEFPMVTVQVVYPGASSSDIETQIVKKVENAVSEVSDIENIISYANENYAWILIDFALHVDPDTKAVEVKDKVEAITKELPKDAEKPVVSKFNMLARPIVDLALYGTDDELALYDYAEKTIKDRLSVIDGVANVSVKGGKERQINIELDNALMRENYVSITDVIRAVSYKNMNVPGGSITKGSKKMNVRLIGEYDSIDQIKDTDVITSEGATIKLSEIAEVKDGFKDIEEIAGYNGGKAVAITVIRKKGGDEVAITRQVRKEIKELKTMLPDGMKLDIVTDAGSVVVSETLASYRNIILGILLTFIMLYFILADIRAAIIASIVIPTSFISTFFLMDFSGFTINMMTLMAFVTALGTLIANALVVIENVAVHMEKGDDRITAAVNGTKEVTVSIFAAAGTNLVVFTPIAFVGGIIGKFLSQFGMTVVYLSIFSLLASFTLTPMLCALFLQPGKKLKKGTFADRVSRSTHKVLDAMIRDYKKIFDWTFDHKKLTIGITLIFAVLSFMIMPYISGQFLPHKDSSRLEINVKANPGTSVQRTSEIVNEIAEYMQNVPEVEKVLSVSGGNKSYEAGIIATLKHVNKRKKSDKDIINDVVPFIAKIPGAEITVAAYSDLAGNNEYDVSFVIYGQEYNKIRMYADKVEKILKEKGYFRSLELSDEQPNEEVQFIPDANKMKYYGVMNAQAGMTLRSAVNGNDSAIFRELGDEYRINISLADEYKKTPEDIRDIDIISKKGLIPFGELGEIKKAFKAPTIKRLNKKRIIQFDGLLYKGSQTEVQSFLDSKMKEIDFDEGYGIKYVGMSEMMIDSMKALGKALVIAIILTFMLLAAILNSLKTPLVIAVSVFTSFVTVGLFLYFTKFGLNLGSIVASIMLVGLSVNNSILLLDYTIQKIREGMEVRKALWEGARVKFRVILMSSVAIMAGVLPSIFDSNLAKSSMGAVIMGGMIGSWVFTFFLTPILFEMSGCHTRLCKDTAKGKRLTVKARKKARKQ